MSSRFLAPLLLLPLLLAGCAESGADAADRTSSPSVTASATAVASPSPSASASASAGAGAGDGAGGGVQPTASASSGGASGGGLPTTKACGGPSLEIALHSTDSGAGSTDYTIAFTNRGRTACHVSGAPRAALIDEQGDPLGADAAGSGHEGDFVRVPPGRSAYTDVRVVNVGSDGGPLAGRCTTRKAVAIAIDAPNYGRYEQVPVAARGCVETDVTALTVSVLRGGS